MHLDKTVSVQVDGVKMHSHRPHIFRPTPCLPWSHGGAESPHVVGRDNHRTLRINCCLGIGGQSESVGFKQILGEDMHVPLTVTTHGPFCFPQAIHSERCLPTQFNALHFLRGTGSEKHRQKKGGEPHKIFFMENMPGSTITPKTCRWTKWSANASLNLPIWLPLAAKGQYRCTFI